MVYAKNRFTTEMERSCFFKGYECVCALSTPLHLKGEDLGWLLLLSSGLTHTSKEPLRSAFRYRSLSH